MLKNIIVHKNIIKLIYKTNPEFFNKNPFAAEFSSYLLYFVSIFIVLVLVTTFMISSILAAIIIAILICHRIFIYWKNKKNFIFFIQGLSKEKGFPISILSKSEKSKIKSEYSFGVADIDNTSIPESIQKFEKDKIYIESINLKNKIQKIYICGVSRIPFLFIYGTLLHSISSKITYLEKDHSAKGWKLMDEKEKIPKIKGYKRINTIVPNSKGQIGLALSFTYPIKHEHLPDPLQAHTLFLEIESPSRNQINNQSTLEKVVKGIVHKIIDHYSSKKTIQEIHLFIAAQTTVVIELGRNYQPKGMHKDVIIHNYDSFSNSYTWALKLCNDQVDIYN